MNEQRSILEYAELSYRFGYMTAVIDKFLGGKAFEDTCRFFVWEFTEELFVIMQSLALQLGVSENVLQETDQLARLEFQAMGEQLLNMQRESDENLRN